MGNTMGFLLEQKAKDSKESNSPEVRPLHLHLEPQLQKDTWQTEVASVILFLAKSVA